MRHRVVWLRDLEEACRGIGRRCEWVRMRRATVRSRAETSRGKSLPGARPGRRGEENGLFTRAISPRQLTKDFGIK